MPVSIWKRAFIIPEGEAPCAAAGEKEATMKFTLLSELAGLGPVAWAGFAAAVVVLAVLLVALRRGQKAPQAPKADPTRTLVYGALCVALSFLLSYLKLFEMPQGGSLTLCSMLPLAFYANRFGVKNGMIAGAAMGFLQLLQNAYVVHWAQLLLDYPIAFAMIGLAGLFPESLPLGILVGGLGRIASSTISGGIFFAEYAWAGWNPWVYSVAYNIIALLPDAVLCIIVAVLPPVKRALATVSAQVAH